MKYLGLFFVLFFLPSFGQIYNCQDDLFPKRDQENKLYGYVNLFGEWQVRSFYDIAKPFKEGLAVVGKRSQFGVISCEGKVVLRIEYQQIKDFVNGFAWVKQMGLWGLVNSKGVLILPCQYEEVEDVSRFGDYAWVKQNGKWGVFDKEKVEFVHPVQFDSYQPLSSQMSLVSANHQKGLVDYGSNILPLKVAYDAIQKFAPYLLAVQKNQVFGVVSDDGKEIVPLKYQELKNLGEGLFAAKWNDKYAIFRYNGQRVVPHVLDQVHTFQSGRCLVNTNGEALYLDGFGQRLFGRNYQDASSFEQNNQAIVKDSNRYFLIDSRGQQISPHYLALENMGEYYAAKTTEGWRVMMKDTTHGSMPIFTEVSGGPMESITVKTKEGYRFYNLYSNQFRSSLCLDKVPVWNANGTYAVVEKSNQFGVIDHSLAMVVPIQFNSIKPVELEGDSYFLAGDAPDSEWYSLGSKFLRMNVGSIKQGHGTQVILETKSGFEIISQTGKQVNGEVYASLELEKGSDFYLFSNHKGRFGLVSSKGDVTLAAKYRAGKNLGNNRFVFETKKTQKIMNQAGQTMFETSQKNIKRYEQCGVYVIQDDFKQGLLNKKGEAITDVIFDEISVFYGVYAIVEKDDWYGIMGKSGTLVRGLDYRSKIIGDNYIILESDNQRVKLFFSGVLE